MAHTDAHAPFRTTAYDNNTPDFVPVIVDDAFGVPINSYDWSAHNRDWHEATKHFPRSEYRKFTERTQTRRRRNHDRRLMNAITKNPDAYDDAVFADHRQDEYAWS